MQSEMSLSVKNTFLSFTEPSKRLVRSYTHCASSFLEVESESIALIMMDTAQDQDFTETNFSGCDSPLALSPVTSSAFDSRRGSLVSEMSTVASESSFAVEGAEGKKRRSSGSKKLGKHVKKNQVAESEFTTVILRNIPTRYTTAWLVEEVQSTGNRCNFVHMPMAQKAPINLGYAFINFVTPEEAKAFMECFAGQGFAKQPRSSKRASVDFASLQGFEQNVDFYSGRRIAKSKNAPWVLRA